MPKIMALNVCSIASKKKKLLLERFNSIHNPDILLLSETHLSGEVYPKFINYGAFYKHRTTNGGGVAILVKNTIRAVSININQNFSFEICGVSIFDGDVEIKIYSIYAPRQNASFGEIMTLINGSTIIGGDFNARMNYNGDGTNPNGDSLRNLIQNSNIEIIIPRSPTCWRNVNGTIIDYFLANEINHGDIRTFTPFVDHSPIQIQFNGQLQKSGFGFFNYKKADWNKINGEINEKIQNILINTTENASIQMIQNATKEFSEITQKTINDLIPKSNKKPFFRTSAAFNKLCIFKCQLQKRILVPGLPYQIKKQLIQQQKIVAVAIRNMLINEHSETIKRNLEAIPKNSDMFAQLKKNCGLGIKNSMPSTLFKDENKTQPISDEKQIANEMVDNFTMKAEIAFHSDSINQEVVNCTNSTIDNLTFKINFNDRINADIDTFENLAAINQILPEDQRGYLTCAEEVKSIIKERSAKKSYGHDQTSMMVIKRFPPNIILFIVTLFNQCIASGIFPEIWKIAVIIPIPKPGKDNTLLNGYRPISQLCSLSKVLEKIVERKIRNFFHINNLFDKNQFGFMKGHSTVHSLSRIQNQIINGLNNKSATIMTLLDIEAAFDTVWHEALLHKMFHRNVPIGFIKIVADYLKHRQLMVQIGNEFSLKKEMIAGTPQGGVLSALLFIIFISDLPNPPGIMRTNFADDTAITFTTNNIQRDKHVLQDAVDQIVNYFHNWKIKVNQSKTEILAIVGSCRDTGAKLRKECKNLTIEINNTAIHTTKKARYLGIIFARNGRFERHIDNIIMKINIGAAKLRGIINRTAINKQIRILLFKTMLSPIITYGCPIWFNPSVISSHQIEKLRKIERKYLRMATEIRRNNDGSKYIRSQILYDFAGNLRIDVRMSNLVKNFFDNCMDSPHDSINQLVSTEQFYDVMNYHCDDQYLPINHIQLLFHNGSLFENNKLLIFNKKRYSNGLVYVTDQ